MLTEGSKLYKQGPKNGPTAILEATPGPCGYHLDFHESFATDYQKENSFSFQDKKRLPQEVEAVA